MNQAIAAGVEINELRRGAGLVGLKRRITVQHEYDVAQPFSVDFGVDFDLDRERPVRRESPSRVIAPAGRQEREPLPARAPRLELYERLVSPRRSTGRLS